MRRTRRRRKARLPARVDYAFRLPAMTGSRICWDLPRFAAWMRVTPIPGARKEGDRPKPIDNRKIVAIISSSGLMT